ncbi:MAG: ATP-binding cassette domain-containing protein [Clostridium sp.]|nr:MAG: ATP-binding cassette domain-containing protein [Clostridium sp.]
MFFSYQNNINAVDDVSFTVDDHKWISIIGHNGSGKSTISKLLVGLLEPKSGEILYDGVLLNNKSANEIRKHVGIVFPKILIINLLVLMSYMILPLA